MKKYITVGIALFLAGIGIMLAAVIASDFDFGNLGTDKYEEVTHTVEGDFENILIATQIHDVTLKPSSDGVCRVVGDESQNIKIKIECNDGILTVKTEDTRKWYNFIGINLGRAELTIYLPDSEYTSLTAASDTGNIHVPNDFGFISSSVATATGNISFEASIEQELGLGSETGNISASNLTLSKFTAETATGNIAIKNIVADDEIDIESDTGKVTLTSCISESMNVDTATGDVILNASDANSIEISTDTGDVEGSLLTAKIFDVDTDTGDVDVPQSSEGGRCKIRTATGDIEITVE